MIKGPLCCILRGQQPNAKPLIRHCGFQPWPPQPIVIGAERNCSLQSSLARLFLFATKKSIQCIPCLGQTSQTPLKIDRKVSQTGLQKRAGHSLPPKGGFMATFVTGLCLAAGAQFCNFNLHTHVYMYIVYLFSLSLFQPTAGQFFDSPASQFLATLYYPL